jgi:alpha/beta hydrolase family protein DUF900
LTYFLNFRARPSGGGVQDPVVWQVAIQQPGAQILSTTQSTPIALANDALGKNIVFATHGFNVNQENGYQELGNWQTLLQLDSSFLFVGMVWPGDSSLIGPLSYPGEGLPAMDCGNRLAQFIHDHLAGAASLSFVSHSLGARFVLQAISQLANSIPVRQVALMAGAIDDDCLTNDYKTAGNWAGKINVLASVKDDVLAAAFPIGNIFEGIIEKGHPYWRAALGHKGPRKQVSGKSTGPYQIPADWDYGHHNYIAVQAPLNPPLTIPQNWPAPPNNQPPFPPNPQNWQPSWSAAFVSSRFR